MAKKIILPSNNLKTFIASFKKEFGRKPTDTEKWSYFDGQVQAFNSMLKTKK